MSAHQGDKNDVNNIDISYEVKSIINQYVQPLALPQSNGHWEGEPGNSRFIINDDYVPLGHGVNPEGLTMGELKSKYNFDEIEYKNKEPDFTQLADKDLGIAKLDEFSAKRTGADGTYELATTTIAKQKGIDSKDVKASMDEKRLTWHEVGDRKTVMPIPTEINAAYKHSGGISVERNVNSFGNYLNDKYGKLSLSRKSPVDEKQSVDINIKTAQKQIRKGIKIHKNKNGKLLESEANQSHANKGIEAVRKKTEHGGTEIFASNTNQSANKGIASFKNKASKQASDNSKGSSAPATAKTPNYNSNTQSKRNEQRR